MIFLITEGKVKLNKTNFEKVKELNVAWGMVEGDPKNVNWEWLEKYLPNIKDEYDELMEAVANRDLKETRDALCDIRVFAYGGDHHIGSNADEDMDAVYESNMSKFIENEEQMEQTIEKYAKIGIVVDPIKTYPLGSVVCPYEQTGTDGQLYRANKRLKGIRFHNPVFKPL